MTAVAIANKIAKKKAKKAAPKTGRRASQCSALVRQRDALNKRISSIERDNAEAAKREQEKIEKRHEAQTKRLEAERDKALKQLSERFGKVCVAQPRKPRSDKGKRKGAAEPTPAEAAPAAKTTAKRAPRKKAAKRSPKAPTSEAAAAAPIPTPRFEPDIPAVFGGVLTRGQLLTNPPASRS